MKNFFIVLGIAVILVGGSISIFKNQIIKYVVIRATTNIIGAPVHMDRFSLSILKSTIHISGFKIYNPGGFPEGTLVYCPKITVIYDRSTLFKKKRHLLLVEFDLKEMEITKNKEGKLNVDSLKIAQQSDFSSSTPMQIDLVTLSIGKIIFKDYTLGTEPSVLVHDVNKSNSYKGIPSAQQLMLLIIAEPIKNAGIKSAAIYGATLLMTGGAALPVAVATTIIGKDSVQQIIDARFEHVYKISLEVAKRMGRITKEDASNGLIKAKISGARVEIIIRKSEDDKTEIKISARKFLFPKLDIAGGVLYQIHDKL